MKKNKHLLLWSSLGTLLILMWAAFHENYLQEWRRIQRNVKQRMPPQQAAAFQVQLRQVVAPELKTYDRCVSCHVGMAPGETGIEGDAKYGKHVPVTHDPAEFACTTCHAGQGRATTKADAHGTVAHWPQPMIPTEYSYAGCGSCHTHLEVPNQARYEKGRALFERNDCLACHRVNKRGGTLRPDGSGGLEGPDLSGVGLKGYDPDWYSKHLLQQQKAVAGPWRTAIGSIPDEDLQAIHEYLNSLVGAPGLVEGKALFHTKGCRGCHKIGGVGGDDGLDLTRVGEKDPALTNFANVRGERTLKNWHKEHFENPASVVPGSQMPALGLTDQEIDLLTFYMFSLRRGPFPEAYWPKDRIRAERFDEREFSTDGQTIYGTFCAACHGPAGEGMRYAGMSPFPAIANPDFLRVASDDFLRGTIRSGRPGRRMPAWGEQEGGLRPGEIEAVIRHVRTLSGNVLFEGDDRPPRWAKGNVQTGERLYQTNCSLCHGTSGEGKEGTALKNRGLLKHATDTYLFKTIYAGRRNTTMNGFGTGSTVRQALTDQEIESIVSFIRTWEEKQ